MNLLLVNDDGFDSPLLLQLCRSAAARGHHVTVCAPTTQQSAKSHSFTVYQPLLIHERTMDGASAAYAVEGTPVDCTRLGVLCLCDPKPDLVISGINLGYNMGLATYVSGTVGAAREAAFQGIPAMAASMHPKTSPETLAFFADWVVHLGEHLLTYAAPPLSVCNVNVPDVPVHQLKAPQVCPINRNVYADGYERRVSPRGGTYFWLAPEVYDDHPVPGSDLDLLLHGHITCTFLTPDPCDQSAFSDFFDEL